MIRKHRIPVRNLAQVERVEAGRGLRGQPHEMHQPQLVTALEQP